MLECDLIDPQYEGAIICRHRRLVALLGPGERRVADSDDIVSSGDLSERLGWSELVNEFCL